MLLLLKSADVTPFLLTVLRSLHGESTIDLNYSEVAKFLRQFGTTFTKEVELSEISSVVGTLQQGNFVPVVRGAMKPGPSSLQLASALIDKVTKTDFHIFQRG